ncbi:MAG: CDP-alcohol phosphatidyltransferase family protein [candidate division WOR-3 bacterium]|nr:CDP-alcohol phosphatidyltransferase family protein [candidate division WOR-3 bacterium]
MIFLPDILTTIRFIITFFVFFSIGKNNLLTLFLLFIAFITDILDGHIARKLGIQNREFGKAYDHLVDKLLVFVVIYGLVLYKNLPNWALILFLMREFLLIIGVIFLWFYKMKIQGSNILGKISGVVFYLMVISYLFNLDISFTMLIISIVFSLLAFLIYAIRGISEFYKYVVSNSSKVRY